MKPNSRITTQQRGFTITQMVITLSIIAIVSTAGVLGIRTARAEFKLQNASRLFATYVEKARADAIRRHGASGQESSVETFGPGSTTYAITMDFGAGVGRFGYGVSGILESQSQYATEAVFIFDE